MFAQTSKCLRLFGQKSLISYGSHLSSQQDLVSRNPLKQKMLSSWASVHRYHFWPQIRGREADPASPSWAGNWAREGVEGVSLGNPRQWASCTWKLDTSTWRIQESLLLNSSLFDFFFSSVWRGSVLIPHIAKREPNRDTLHSPNF